MTQTKETVSPLLASHLLFSLGFCMAMLHSVLYPYSNIVLHVGMVSGTLAIITFTAWAITQRTAQ